MIIAWNGVFMDSFIGTMALLLYGIMAISIGITMGGFIEKMVQPLKHFFEKNGISTAGFIAKVVPRLSGMAELNNGGLMVICTVKMVQPLNGKMVKKIGIVMARSIALMGLPSNGSVGAKNGGSMVFAIGKTVQPLNTMKMRIMMKILSMELNTISSVRISPKLIF